MDDVAFDVLRGLPPGNVASVVSIPTVGQDLGTVGQDRRRIIH